MNTIIIQMMYDDMRLDEVTAADLSNILVVTIINK